ncbi:hypothetical protein HY633_00865 [Candidatus Uhrbacteria bacterium]|nr:hypothetical protein [Candidatus Uhrbacteria bacterium]
MENINVPYRHSRYIEIMTTRGYKAGQERAGETRLVMDPDELRRHEELLVEMWTKKGLPAEFARVGVVWESPWFSVINQAIFYPGKDGREIASGHIDVVWYGEARGEKSVFLLSFTEDGRLLMNRTYRTTIRRWTLECIGTITGPGENFEKAVERCAREKLGRQVLVLKPLGNCLDERGVMGAAVPMHAALVPNAQSHELVDWEPRDTELLAISEVNEAFRQGKFLKNGEEYLCVDGYTGFALRQAELQGLIRPDGSVDMYWFSH